MDVTANIFLIACTALGVYYGVCEYIEVYNISKVYTEALFCGGFYCVVGMLIGLLPHIIRLLSNALCIKDTREIEILKKFKGGAIIDSEEEMEVLEKWAITGVVKFGTDFEEMKAEASLTKKGEWRIYHWW